MLIFVPHSLPPNNKSTQAIAIPNFIDNSKVLNSFDVVQHMLCCLKMDLVQCTHVLTYNIYGKQNVLVNMNKVI